MEKKQTVLIVDDSPVNIKVLYEILGSEHDVIFAGDGNDALELSVSESPDLILLDIIMPGIDGYEVCRRLKSDPRTRAIPVIFITSMEQEADETKGLSLGAIDYITKPISPAIVKARVRNHLELKRYRDFLEGLSMMDGLTGIANRRRFDEYLDQEWRRAGRTAQPLSLIMMDIDFFKNYNDNYGHAAGDDCLKQVARSLTTALKRPGDVVARYGGEEFACILPETDGPGALQVAEALRESIILLGIPHAYSEAASYVTLSIGAVTASRDTSREKLIEEADRLMYVSKKSGRDRITHADLAGGRR